MFTLHGLRNRVGVLLLVGFAAAMPQVGAAADVVTIDIQSQSDVDQYEVPFTFGHVFREGDIPAGSGVVARLLDGTPVPLQIDKKATHGDGSLRHAVVTANLPFLSSGASQTLILGDGDMPTASAPVELADVLASGFDANVSLNVGGTVYTASAAELLKHGPVKQWLAGDQVSEWIVGGPVTAGGNAHPHLTAYFHVRAYAGLERIRVDVVLENNWTYVSGPRNIGYDATITVGGETVYRKSGVQHYHHARWHKTFWYGVQPQGYVKHDPRYLQETKAVSRYVDVQPTENYLNGLIRDIAPMTNGMLEEAMHSTGESPSIGPLPQWTAVYVISTDPRAYRATLLNGDGGGAYGAHYRDQATGLPISIDDHPNTSVSSGAELPSNSGANPYKHDLAHQPSIAYVPYLVSGDYFYLEELQFWATYNMLYTPARTRERQVGAQVRGQAWSLRTLGQAAYATPDDHPLKAYFVNRVARYMQAYDAQYTNNPNANKLGVIWSYADLVSPDKLSNAYFVTWMDDYFTWAVGHLAELGFKEAEGLRSWKAQFPANRVGGDEFCWQVATPSHIQMGVGETWYDNLRQVYEANFPFELTRRECNSQAFVDYVAANVSGERGKFLHDEMIAYGHMPDGHPSKLQPALAIAVDAGVPNAALAWQRLANRADAPDYRNNPKYAVVPRSLADPYVLDLGPASGAPVTTNAPATPVEPAAALPESNATDSLAAPSGGDETSGAETQNQPADQSESSAPLNPFAAPVAPLVESVSLGNVVAAPLSGPLSGGAGAANPLFLILLGIMAARRIRVRRNAATVMRTAGVTTAILLSGCVDSSGAVDGNIAVAADIDHVVEASSDHVVETASDAITFNAVETTTNTNTTASATTIPPTVESPIAEGNLQGQVDSSLVNGNGLNKVYVFAGNVTPDDIDGAGVEPIATAPIYQNDAECTWSYELGALTQGEYTVALTKEAATDDPEQDDSLTFLGTGLVSVGDNTSWDFAPANVVRVGPGRAYATPSEAAAVAKDGDVIEIDAGEYVDDIAVWRQNNITLRGVGGLAQLRATRTIGYQPGNDKANGMAIWVTKGRDIRVENVSISGARVSDGNGAGLRAEGKNLTVCGAKFKDNENGILGGAGNVLIEYSEFDHNGIGEYGKTHNMYITGDRLTLRHSYTHHAYVGHNVKTRAKENYILYNRIMDEAEGNSSYDVDIPNGGLSFLIGNLIHHGANADNTTLVAYGAEGLKSGRTHHLYLANNTLVNDLGRGVFVSVRQGGSAKLVNNLFVGSGTVLKGAGEQVNNLATTGPGLVDIDGYDYRLLPDSPARDAGIAPGTGDGFDLNPLYHYAHKASRALRPVDGTLDIGAYEYIP